MRLRALLFVVAIPLAYAGGVLASWRLSDGCGDLPGAQAEGASWRSDWSWLPPHTTCRVDSATTTTVYYESWEVAGVFFAFFLLLAALMLAPARWDARTVAIRAAAGLSATVAIAVWVFL